MPNEVVIFLRIAHRFRSFALSTRMKTNCTPAPRRIVLKCGRKVNALLAFEVFSCSFGNAGGTEGLNIVVISLRIARRFRSFALSTRTKANCAPVPRRIALKCGRKVNALIAFEYSGNFPQNNPSISVFRAVDENES